MSFALDQKFTIIKRRVEDAVNLLCEKNYGLHLMLIYPNIEALMQFYIHYSKKEINDYNGVVIIASFYETKDSLRSTFTHTYPTLDMAKYEQDKSLTILDSRQLYFTHQVVVEFIIKINKFLKQSNEL